MRVKPSPFVWQYASIQRCHWIEITPIIAVERIAMQETMRRRPDEIGTSSELIDSFKCV